jgi:hypothetical protein
MAMIHLSIIYVFFSAIKAQRKEAVTKMICPRKHTNFIVQPFREKSLLTLNLEQYVYTDWNSKSNSD